jgi:purine-binding chemotaxis protein CheW
VADLLEERMAEGPNLLPPEADWPAGPAEALGLPDWLTGLGPPEPDGPPPAPPVENAPAEPEAPPVVSPPAEAGALDELLASLAAELGADQPAPAPAERPSARYIRFTLASTDFLVSIAGVVETGRLPAWAPVPGVHDWVLGVANVRGDVLSLIDLRGFFGLGARPAGPGRLLVVRASDGLTVGLLVDQVKGTCALSADCFKLIEGGHDRLGACLDGAADLDGRLAVRLDLDRLLLSPAFRATGPAPAA